MKADLFQYLVGTENPADKAWAKLVEDVTDARGGYAFEGAWLNGQRYPGKHLILAKIGADAYLVMAYVPEGDAPIHFEELQHTTGYLDEFKINARRALIEIAKQTPFVQVAQPEPTQPEQPAFSIAAIRMATVTAVADLLSKKGK